FSPLGSEPCAPWTDCLRGSRVVSDGTPTTDRVCAPCPPDQTTTEPNARTCSDVTVVDLGVGGNASCAVLSDGSIRCWGDDEAGQLGLATTQNLGDNELPVSVPAVRVSDSPGVGVARAAMSLFTACAVLTDDRVKCWGSNL